jgi:hypothetical protein
MRKAAGLEEAYADQAVLVAGHGHIAQCPSPGWVARLLESLDGHLGQTVAELGTGTAYRPAPLCHMDGHGGRVRTCDPNGERAGIAGARLLELRREYPGLRWSWDDGWLLGEERNIIDRLVAGPFLSSSPFVSDRLRGQVCGCSRGSTVWTRGRPPCGPGTSGCSTSTPEATWWCNPSGPRGNSAATRRSWPPGTGWSRTGKPRGPPRSVTSRWRFPNPPGRHPRALAGAGHLAHLGPGTSPLIPGGAPAPFGP